MKKIKVLLILFSILFTSCQSVKDGLSGRKNDNSDEFLVQKKQPLVTPPNYMELPEPKNASENFEENNSIEKSIDIKKILDIKNSSETDIISKKSNSAEDFVLKQIQDK